MNRDPIDVAKEAVDAALTGSEWEVRDDYPYPTGVCQNWVERGTGAEMERFLDAALEPEDACKVERLLEVARADRVEVELLGLALANMTELWKIAAGVDGSEVI